MGLHFGSHLLKSNRLVGELLGHDALGSHTGLCASLLVLAMGHPGSHLRTDMSQLPDQAHGLDMLYLHQITSFPPQETYIFLTYSLQYNRKRQIKLLLPSLSFFPQQNTTIQQIKFIARILCCARRQPQIQVSLLAVIKAFPVMSQDRPTVVLQQPTLGSEQK